MRQPSYGYNSPFPCFLVSLSSGMLTKATIDISLLGYATLVGFLLLKRNNQPTPNWIKLVSTAGCLLCVFHIALAMHYYHHWSLADAVRHTAAVTHETVGLRFGGGVFFNFVFVIFWLLDVAWSWVHAASYDQRPKWVTLTLHAYLVFIAINGAVIFENGPVRWVGLGVCIALGSLLVWKPRPILPPPE